MFAHGVKLDQQKRASLKNGITPLTAPDGLPEAGRSAPLRKDAGAKRILAAAQAAGIADELNGAPLGRELSRIESQKADLLVACGFDEDPYTSCSSAVLRDCPGEVADGLELAARACGARSAAVAAVSAGEARRFQKACPGTETFAAGNRYPARILLAQELRRRGKRPAWAGAQALAALAAAVRRGESQSETVVTVAGDGVQEWMNCRVRIGTPIRDVLAAGRPEDGVRLVVIGSSVTGRTVKDLSLPVTAATRCVIALKKVPPQRPFPCIGCGRCAKACPAGVIPWLVLREMESGTPDTLRLFHVESCADCGACGIVCPSGIDLAAAVKRAAALKEGGNDETA